MELEKILQIIILVLFMMWLIKYHFKGQKIEKKKIYKICIEKLQNRVKRPSHQYIPDENIYERFHKCNTDELALIALAQDILKHCGYKPAGLYVKVTKKKFLRYLFMNVCISF